MQFATVWKVLQHVLSRMLSLSAYTMSVVLIASHYSLHTDTVGCTAAQHKSCYGVWTERSRIGRRRRRTWRSRTGQRHNSPRQRKLPHDDSAVYVEDRSKKALTAHEIMFFKLKQQAPRRRAAPPPRSIPSTAPPRSTALCHRLTRVLRSQITRLWPLQPPLSTSRAHDSLPTHHAYAGMSSVCSV